MDQAALRKLALDAAFDILPGGGLKATIRLKGGAELVDVPVLWLPNEDQSSGLGEIQRHEPIRVLAVKRADVPSLPVGSVIVVPGASGLEPRTWKTDGPEHVEADHRRVLVVPAEGH